MLVAEHRYMPASEGVKLVRGMDPSSFICLLKSQLHLENEHIFALYLWLFHIHEKLIQKSFT